MTFCLEDGRECVSCGWLLGEWDRWARLHSDAGEELAYAAQDHEDAYGQVDNAAAQGLLAAVMIALIATGARARGRSSPLFWQPSFLSRPACSHAPHALAWEWGSVQDVGEVHGCWFCLFGELGGSRTGFVLVVVVGCLWSGR